MVEWECELYYLFRPVCWISSFYTTAFHHNSAVIILRTEIEENVLRVHLRSEDFCQFLALAVEHLCLEPLVHAVLCPLHLRIEVEIPVIYPRHMSAIPVQLNHIQMIAAVLVAFLILDDDEERFR